MTNQDIFDTVAIHLIKQGKKSADANGDCLYRSPEGLKCAVGCLIPDEVYDPEMEERVISRLLGCYDSLNFLWPYYDLLNDLQRTHDMLLTENQTWKDAVILRLYELAEKYNLSTAALDT
jgi:hypothetical protein